MVVLVVEKATASLRGELSRWLIEPKTGIFVGNLSAMVRDKLWEKVVAGVGRGKMTGALLLHSAQNEQGFSVRSFGVTGRELRDFDGLTLVFIARRNVKTVAQSDAQRTTSVEEDEKTCMVDSAEGKPIPVHEEKQE